MLNHLTGNPNRPPHVDHVSLTPDPPRTDDTVSVTAQVSDADQDPTNARQEQVKTSYAWFVGDTLLDETGPTLDLSAPGHGDRGDTITVRVSAYDGLDTTVETSQRGDRRLGSDRLPRPSRTRASSTATPWLRSR